MASEIKALAARVQSNTGDIREMLSSLDGHTQSAASALARSEDSVSIGLELASASQQTLQEISRAVAPG